MMMFRSSHPSNITWVVRACRLSTSPITLTNIDNNNNSNPIGEYANAKPFNQIPGPPSFPGFGMLWSYLKNDRFYLKRPHLFMLKNKQDYGPIYAEAIGSTRYIMATQPEDIAKTFKAEGTYPSRGPVYPWLCYREQRKKAKGVLIGEGEEWRQSRSVIDKKLLRLKDVSRYTDRMNKVDTSFINLVKKEWTGDQHSGEISCLRYHLYKWSFETINTVLFSKSLGAFNEPPTPIAAKFYNNVLDMLNATNELLFYPPYYKYIKTSYWKQYCSYWDTLFEVGGQLIDEARQALKDKGIFVDGDNVSRNQLNELEFLPYIILRGELSDDEIASNLIELMTAAVDTSANTILWTLYILGNHKDIRDKLYREIQSVVKKGKHPNFQDIQNMPYLRGLIKESQRIYPVIIFTARLISQDLVLSGYQIPANTLVSCGHYAMSHDETIYDEPHKIKPERWMRSVSNRQSNAFSYIPFGFGPRMCIGRRIAELEMQLLIARMVEEFDIECLNKTEVGMINKFVMTPDSNIELKLTVRNQ